MASKPKYRDNSFIWDIKDFIMCFKTPEAKALAYK